MIGNDIIDLRQAKFKNAERFKRYAQKICTPQELEVFGQYESKDLSLWRFWSLKEAAYKAAVRLGYTGRFSPHNTKVDLIDAVKAEVFLDNFLFFAISSFTTEYVYAEVCQFDEQKRTTHTIIDLQEGDSLPYKFQKEGRLPFLVDESGSRHPASISHHGRFYSLMHTV